MSREIRRVPIDFNWELNKVWIGFINPYDFSKNCTACDGTGLNSASRQLWDDWYDSKGHGTRWHYLYKDGVACEIVGDCRRWLDKLTQDEVDELVKEGRYDSLTSDWDKENRKWIPKNPPVIITAEQVNAQNRVGVRGMGHDAINMSICFRVRANRLGIYGECKHCDHGTIWKSQAHKYIQNTWKPIAPPTGEGWQVWETVSEGSPISQVFPTAEALIEHLVTIGLNWGASKGPYSRQAAENFVKGSGWVPSAIIADIMTLSVLDIKVQNYIPLDQCVEGGLYRIRSRNLNYGVFTQNRFIGIREKFTYLSLESDYHVESGIRGSCSPKELLEICPVSLNEQDKLFSWLKEAEKRYNGLG